MRRTLRPAALRRRTAMGTRSNWRGLSTAVSARTVGLVATDETATEFAQRAAAAGHTLRVCLGPGAPDDLLSSTGLQAVESLAALADECDVVVTMLAPTQRLGQVYSLTTSPDYSPLGLDVEDGPTVDPLPLEKLRRGMVLIDVSRGSLTGILDDEHLKSSGALQELAGAARFRDATVIEASVPVHRQMASNTLLVAGDSATVETWRPLLNCIPTRFQHRNQEDESAPAPELKTIYCGDEMLGWLETRSLAARFGLAPGAVDALIDQIPRPAIAEEGRSDGDVVDAPLPVDVTVEMMESQLRDAVESARKIQAPVPLGALVAQVYGMVGTGGYMDLDYSIVDRAIYGIANAEATQQPGQVALSVDTIQQSLDFERSELSDRRVSVGGMQAIEEEIDETISVQ